MINRITLVGNVGQDAELRTTQSGQPYAYCRVATNESYKDAQGSWQQSTEWHTVKIWGQSSNRAASTIKKGLKVYIEGSLRSFKDKSGNTLWEVKADVWKLLDAPKNDYLLPPEPAQPTTPSPWGQGFTNR